MENKLDEILTYTKAELLSTSELALLVNSSRKNRDLFQPMLNERKLLHLVIHGKLAQVPTLLEQDLKSLFKKTTVTGLTCKTFNQISTFDYIILALSPREFNNVLSCLPQTEESNQVVEQLRAQYNDPAHLLLHHVVRGDYAAVGALLRRDINLLNVKRRIIDLSGRIFENITAFQYALWALDSRMWKIMLKYLPKNEQGHKIGEELRIQYHSQAQGLTYRLDGELFIESHFNFQQTILKELQTQLDLRNYTGVKDWNVMSKQWIEGVGGAQRLLPAHVVYEYCFEERSFQSTPDFTTYPKPSNYFYNNLTKRIESWSMYNTRLGIDFAVYKRPHEDGRASCVGNYFSMGVRQDLRAMTELFKVRTNDFIKLAIHLGITPDNQPSVSPI